MATVHFVVKELHETEGRALLDKTIATVENIKGSKFNESDIEWAINELEKHEYLKWEKPN